MSESRHTPGPWSGSPARAEQDAQIKAEDMAIVTDRQNQIDTYGLALMMIREGVVDPGRVAREALAKFGK